MRRHQPKCEKCDAPNCIKHYRLDPVNWRARYKLLCRPCGNKLGYTPVTYGTSNAVGRAT